MVCFHNPDEENGYLSNWYLSDFVVEGQKFSSMEQYMMHKKALVFGDDATATKVLETNDVGKIKAIGLSLRDERRFDMREWQGQNLLGFALMEVRRSLVGDD